MGPHSTSLRQYGVNANLAHYMMHITLRDENAWDRAIHLCYYEWLSMFGRPIYASLTSHADRGKFDNLLNPLVNASPSWAEVVANSQTIVWEHLESKYPITEKEMLFSLFWLHWKLPQWRIETSKMCTSTVIRITVTINLLRADYMKTTKQTKAQQNRINVVWDNIVIVFHPAFLASRDRIILCAKSTR